MFNYRVNYDYKKFNFERLSLKVLEKSVLYCTVLYCTVLYCTVLYCTVLYCTVYLLAYIVRMSTQCIVGCILPPVVPQHGHSTLRHPLGGDKVVVPKHTIFRQIGRPLYLFPRLFIIASNCTLH